jgi:hypothetical protein
VQDVPALADGEGALAGPGEVEQQRALRERRDDRRPRRGILALRPLGGRRQGHPEGEGREREPHRAPRAA